LIDIRERIALNDQYVSKNIFVQSASLVLKIARSYKGTTYLSYFDVLTAIAFHVFMAENMEWVVLETGLGGRADSTNVTDKKICVITRIGLDHMEVLGRSLKEIAAEKTGIARTGIPVITAPQATGLKPWLQKHFNSKNVPVYFVEDFFREQFLDADITADFIPIPWLECLQTSLCTMQVLFNEDRLKKQIWFEAVKKVKLAGRLDLRQNVTWSKHSLEFKTMLLDGAHNRDALIALSEYISKKNLIPFTLILGMASDKLDDTLRSPLVELCSQAEQLIITPIPSPRTASPEMMGKFLDECGALAHSPEIKDVNSAEEALEVSLDYREQPVVVAGSIYLVGLVLQILENRRGS
jgi:dihydrofolate synthase/folylpolyglutamate synthase